MYPKNVPHAETDTILMRWHQDRLDPSTSFRHNLRIPKAEFFTRKHFSTKYQGYTALSWWR